MATRKIVDCKDLSTGNKVFPRTHAAAVLLSDGRSVDMAIEQAEAAQEFFLTEEEADGKYQPLGAEGQQEVCAVELGLSDVTGSYVYDTILQAWDNGVRNYVGIVDEFGVANLKVIYNTVEEDMPAPLSETGNAGDVYFVLNATIGETFNGHPYVTVIQWTVYKTEVYVELKYLENAYEKDESYNNINSLRILIYPFIFYVFGTMSNLEIILDNKTTSYIEEFVFQFTSGSTPTTLTLPSTITWAEGLSDVSSNVLIPTANSTYQVSIVDNKGVYVKFPA